MAYIATAQKELLRELPSGLMDSALLDQYTLLVLVKGERTTLKDVHDAWSVWRSRTKPEHKFLVPFEELSEEVRELDRQYAEAIVRTAARLKK